MRTGVVTCGLGAVIVLCAALAAEEFNLDVPGDPGFSSIAEIDGDALIITDADGQTFEYVREPRQDSRDRQYLGYYSAQAGQFLRWPARGAGAMQIGTPVGNGVSWATSRMRVRGAGPAAAPEREPLRGDMHVAVVADGEASQTVAHVDAAGQLHFYRGFGDQWEHILANLSPGSLVPGADLKLLAGAAGGLPVVFTVGAKGNVQQILDGQRVRKLTGVEEAGFVPGSAFDLVSIGRNQTLFAVDARGRVRELDVAGGDHSVIEKRSGLFEPGAAVRSVDPAGNQVVLIDRRGGLVTYTRDPVAGWRGPELIDTGYVSAASVTAWVIPGDDRANDTFHIAAVDRAGKLKVAGFDGAEWGIETVAAAGRFPAGAPVAVWQDREAPHLSAVTTSGNWVELVVGARGWSEREIASGFPLRAPVAASELGPSVYAVDMTGRLVAGTWEGNAWRCVLCLPEETRAVARLGRRRQILNRNIDPATIELVNPSDEQLVVRLFDSRGPGRVQEFAMEPGGAVKFRADRDAGGTLEEVFFVPGPFGEPVEQIRQFVLPPQPLYDVVVYANRVQYQYIDRRKKPGPLPDFDERGLVSLGAFQLPPGEVLGPNAQIDVYQAAIESGVPGLVAP